MGWSLPAEVVQQNLRHIAAARIGRLAIWAAAALATLMAAPSHAADFMFRARVDGRMLEGRPLAWDAARMLLLGRDGRLHDFDPRAATEGRKTSPRFFSYTMSEMKRELYYEFGEHSDISTTNRYIVVHPRGEKSLWAQRFEDLHRTFVRYFRVRGFSPSEPEFPLVAVVFNSEAEYFRHAASSGSTMTPGTLGHYDPESNRVFLFDVTSEGGDWSQNASTIIHEAVHQSAYNTGIHSRFAEGPRWLVEGLATMFEARGVWDGRRGDTQRERVNWGRLRDFRKYAAGKRSEDSLKRLISSDTPFRTNPLGAYAESWALSFYLCETHPRKYCDYLSRTADRALFSGYPAAERVADFEAFFGEHWRMLDVKFLRFMEEVK